MVLDIVSTEPGSSTRGIGRLLDVRDLLPDDYPKKKVQQLYDSFAGFVSKVNKFINTIKRKDLFEETDIYIETEFPATRQRKVKKMPGEECVDESSTISQQGPSKKI
ncbi:hypothetical protein ILUMI_18009 [Ignelater luminosus]|uniref:Uncharacterized protein n=1 Tax=Ignelater luminosus TaxID=2038154 RepID=A0A8K0G6T3_IGNLU|nr:hypothetical protein ILUMI_18009 [Ignelater luminosus]